MNPHFKRNAELTPPFPLYIFRGGMYWSWAALALLCITVFSRPTKTPKREVQRWSFKNASLIFGEPLPSPCVFFSIPLCVWRIFLVYFAHFFVNFARFLPSPPPPQLLSRAFLPYTAHVFNFELTHAETTSNMDQFMCRALKPAARSEALTY